MRTISLLIAWLGLLSAGAAALADGVRSTDHGLLQGSVQEATVSVDGVRRIYVREQLQAIELAAEGPDSLTLADGARVQGKVLCVTVRSPDGLYAIARSKLRSIALEEPLEPLAQPEPRPAAAAPSPEQQRALAINAELHKAFASKVKALHAVDIQNVRRRYMRRCEELFARLDPLERRVQQKLQRRQAARDDPARTQALLRTDGLEADQRALREARRQKLKLRSIIEEELAGVERRSERRTELVDRTEKQNRAELLAGHLLTEGEMTSRYEAALTGLTAEERAARVKVRTLKHGVKMRRGESADTPELIVDPFPEDG